MADNNFETNMHRQMEDFKISPSGEVWQKVEEQLQKDKRRRRWFFILPITILLTAGLGFGIYQWGKNKGIAETVVQQNHNAIIDKKEQSAESNNPATALPKSNTSTAKHSIKNEFIKKNEDEREQQKSVSSVKPSNNTATQKLFVKLSSEKKTNTTEKNVAHKQKKSDDVVVHTKIAPPANTPVKSSISKGESEPVKTEIAIVETKPTVEQELVNNIKIISSDSTSSSSNTSSDSSIVVKPTNKKSPNKTKWNMGFEGGVGFSGVNNYSNAGFPAYSNSGSIAGGPGNLPVAIGSESKIKSAVSFNLGVTASKKISKQNFIVTGLRYQFASTKRNIGVAVNSGNASVQFRDYGTINAQTSFSGGDTATYKTKYHFLQVPILFEHVVGKKQLFSYYAGVTPSLLLSSNALAFNKNDGRYYRSAEMHRNAQFFLNGGFNCKPSIKSKFSIGPEFNYGVLNFFKQNGPQQRLFTGTLKLRWMLQ